MEAMSSPSTEILGHSNLARKACFLSNRLPRQIIILNESFTPRHILRENCFDHSAHLVLTAMPFLL